jgi:NADP-dependent 3-hydroxy acid dehydrogenase YdfG
MAADVTDITENENIMQKTIDHFGRLDAVFLNAGTCLCALQALHAVHT